MSKQVKLPGNATAGVVPQADGSGHVSWLPPAVPEVNTTGKTSAQIDALFPSTPANGSVASDPTNSLKLVRQAGKWYKTAALTQIA